MAANEEETLSPQDQIKKMGQDIANFQVDPERSATILQHLYSDLSRQAPNIQAAAMGHVSRAIDYLGQEIPKGNTVANALNPDPYEPSDRMISQFQRKVQAVMDPLSVLQDLKDGTITKEHVHALENVYPNLTAAIREKAATMLADPTLNLTPTTRAAFNLFMNSQSATQLSGPKVTALQQNFIQQDMSKPKANSKIQASSRTGTGV